MKNKEIEELLKGMRDVSNTEGCSMNLDRYLVKLLLSYIEQLKEKLKYSIGIVQHNQIVTKLSKENQQLENNIDKALELIEKELKYPPKYLTGYSAIQVLNILKGDSD